MAPKLHGQGHRAAYMRYWKVRSAWELTIKNPPGQLKCQNAHLPPKLSFPTVSTVGVMTSRGVGRPPCNGPQIAWARSSGSVHEILEGPVGLGANHKKPSWSTQMPKCPPSAETFVSDGFYSRSDDI